MPQMGLHMVVGVELGAALPGPSRATRWGLLAGSIIPDFDFAPLIALRFFDRDLAVSMHRSITHSVFFLLGCLALMVLLGVLARRGSFVRLGFGLTLALLVHALLDSVMWFSAVDLWWPLGSEPFNLYGDWVAPDWAWNLVMAAEPGAYALFVLYLTKWRGLSIPQVWTRWALTLAFLSGMLLVPVPLLPREHFEVLAYSIGISIGFIPAVVLIIIMKDEILAGSSSTTPRPEVALHEG